MIFLAIGIVEAPLWNGGGRHRGVRFDALFHDLSDEVVTVTSENSRDGKSLFLF